MADPIDKWTDERLEKEIGNCLPNNPAYAALTGERARRARQKTDENIAAQKERHHVDTIAVARSADRTAKIALVISIASFIVALYAATK